MVFTVDPDRLHDASAVMVGAANAVAAVDIAADLAILAGALPGSAVSAGQADVASGWSARISALRDAVWVQGGSLGGAAGSYAGAEASVRTSLAERPGS